MDLNERINAVPSAQLEKAIGKEFQKEIQFLMKQAIKNKEAHVFNTEAARGAAVNLIRNRVNSILANLSDGM